MNAYCTEVCKLEAHFEGLEFHHVCRDNNVAADLLSKLGSKRALVPVGVFVQDLRKPAIRLLSDPEMSQGNVPPPGSCNVSWRRPKMIGASTSSPTSSKRVPEDKVECEKIVRRSANYVVIGTELYQRSASNCVLMKCILRSEGLQLLQEIHGGECGNHAASGNLVGKAFRSSFYWPTALADSQDVVRWCKGCQFFAKRQHVPAQALRTIPLSWPFAIWGLNSVGPFKMATSGYKHILVAVDKFTKWIEVWAVSTVTSKEAAKFIEDITHRFGVSNRMVTDLGKAFTGSDLWDFYQDSLIDVYYCSVAHAHCNG
jgi:hypothetical protein